VLLIAKLRKKIAAQTVTTLAKIASRRCRSAGLGPSSLATMAENEQSMHLSIVLISDQMGPSRPLRFVRSCPLDAIDPDEVITAVAKTVVKLLAAKMVGHM
jgi:hypothetical protein